MNTEAMRSVAVVLGGIRQGMVPADGLFLIKPARFVVARDTETLIDRYR